MAAKGLSTKVDLTEHRDFQKSWEPNANTFAADLREIGTYLNNDILTIDQYNKIVMFEILFGRKVYYTSAPMLFDKRREYIDSRCPRCGKKTLFPWWATHHFVCKECYEYNKYSVDGKLPWRKTSNQVGWGRERDAKEIFALK